MNPHLESTAPGIVLPFSSLQLQCMNQQAVQLLKRLDEPTLQLGSYRNFSAALHPHCRDIIAAMRERPATNNFKLFHLYRAIGGSEQQILLKGVGLLDQRGWPYSRIVMRLSPHVHRAMDSPTAGQLPVHP